MPPKSGFFMSQRLATIVLVSLDLLKPRNMVAT